MSEKVSIILLTCGLPDVSARCIEHLGANTHHRPVQLVWVDNGSTREERDQVRTAIERHCNFELREVDLAQNAGWVGGCLAGLAEADRGSRYIGLLNNDTRPDPYWLTPLVEVLEHYPQVGIVGSLTQNAQQWQGIPMLRGRWAEISAAPLPPDEIGPWLRAHRARAVRIVPGMVAFFSVLLRREMIDQIGFLDPIFGLGLADDDDYCARAADAGWQVAVALDSYVPHDHRTTFYHLSDQGLIDLETLQRQNLNLFRTKRRRMAAKQIEPGVVLRYLGHNGSPFVMGIPARDLTQQDLTSLELESGILRVDVLRSGLYMEVVADDEVLGPGPFCGALLAMGERCREPVAAWGDRCSEHKFPPLQAISGIGPATEKMLRAAGIRNVSMLADLVDETLRALAEDLARVSEEQLKKWRAIARTLVGWTGENDNDA